MDEETKKTIIQDLNVRIGDNINYLTNAKVVELEIDQKKEQLQSRLDEANKEVPAKIATAIQKAELNSKKIDDLKIRNVELNDKVHKFLLKTEPLRSEIDKRFSDINKLEQVLLYLNSFEKIEDLSRQLKHSNDDEQMVLLYGELKEMCQLHTKGHRANYVKDYTHYWHNVLKEKLTKQYDDVLKQLKWPFTTAVENMPASKEVIVKFTNLTRYLFIIQEPENPSANIPLSDDFSQVSDPCLPVRLLLRSLKKRFIFHFTGSRQTARIDRPEWFLTQTLTWIKDHQSFVRSHVQPVADKLELKNVRAEDEFNAGLIGLAAERLHTVLALYHTQGSNGELVDVDAAFAHAVDETLGFHRELVTITGNDDNSVLSVLTKAETFIRWLAVEKKYALAKMEEILDNEQWSEPVAGGVGAAIGSMLWVPRGADWFIALLKTIEDRYAVLPQPGHRLQFLELQLELIEEWRMRLTQLLSAATSTLHVDSFLLPGTTPHPLIAVINSAHHMRTVLLQWAHSLHYLQLHYYRRQFQNFTQQQHHDEVCESASSSSSQDDDESDEDSTKKNSKAEGDIDETLSLKEVEVRAKKLALNEVSRRNSLISELNQYDVTAPIANLAVTDPLPVDTDIEEAGVFAEAPALLALLRAAGLDALAEHIMLEFKAGLREYKRNKWHGLLIVEESALSVSSALCGPLAALTARLSSAAARLAPALAGRLRSHLAAMLDEHMFQEVVLENWFNTGGTMQFTHDVKRNLVPTFAPPNQIASKINQMPKLYEACKLLNMDYEDARRLRSALLKQPIHATDNLKLQDIRHIPPDDALQILNQRTDLSEASSPSSVMELF